MNFVFKMASSANVVFIDRRIMDVAFLISLTHKMLVVSSGVERCDDDDDDDDAVRSHDFDSKTHSSMHWDSN